MELLKAVLSVVIAHEPMLFKQYIAYKTVFHVVYEA